MLLNARAYAHTHTCSFILLFFAIASDWKQESRPQRLLEES